MIRSGFYCLDCFDGLSKIPDGFVDFVFTDLPYGMTQNSWDVPIDLSKMWTELRRVTNLNAAMVFTAMQPFTSKLLISNVLDFKFSMVWEKNKPRGFLNAKKRPLVLHEDILVFYQKQPPYCPQMTVSQKPVHSYTKHSSDGTNYGKTKLGFKGGGSLERYPTSILKIPVLNNDSPFRIHPTQKPVELPEYFIKTYTIPGQTVLDITAGSGSTLLAASGLDRNYIGFEKDPVMYEKAFQWINS